MRVIKKTRLWAWIALFVCGVSSAFAQTTLNVSTSFTAAQSGRSYMDIGGVWNGSAEVTNTSGDTFTLTITNAGTATAFEIQPRVTLPAHFQYVTGTASVSLSSGGPITVTASQSVNTLTFTPSGSYDLPAGVTMTITYGLRVLSTMPSSGTYSLTPAVHYATTDGGSRTQTPTFTNQNILVQQGAKIITVSPLNQLKAVNQNALFTVSVTNTGLGALYDVTINESAINPGGSLQLVSMTKTAPTRAATGSSPILTMPYLAPGESFVVDVVATVTGCSDILNTVSTTDRKDNTATNTTAPVVLDLQQPLITYTPPNVTLSYSATTSVSVNVQNTGLGDALGVSLDTNFESLGVTVSSISAGWTYNATNGVFTRTGGTPAGSIPNSSSATLSFNLDPTTTTYCSDSVGGTVIWKSSYTNGCGDAYSTPTNTSSVSAPTNNPTLTLSQTGPGQRIANGEKGSFVVTLNATNTTLISGTSFTVTESLPAGITGVSLVASSGAAVYNAMTNTVTWSGITKTSPTTNATLTINFTAQADPCAAGTQYTATATASATTTRSCPLSASASATYLLTNNPGATVQQYFEVTPAADGFFETGINSTNNTTREIALGEGEFIQLEARYVFDAGYAGFWTGSTYVDDFAGVTQQVLVPNTLQYSINNGSSWVAIDDDDVTGGTGSLSISLSFLQDVYGDNNVSGKSLRIRYSTTIPDAGLNGSNTRSLLQRAHLTISGTGGAGACTVSGSNFRQGVFYSIARAAAIISVDLPSSGGNQISICQVIDVTLRVNNATVEQARNLRVTLDNNPSHYEFLTGASQTITYGGVFNSGNISYSENGGINPTWTFTGSTLTGEGTITFKARLKATAPLTPSALRATVDYDDLQTHITPARDFPASGSGAPFLVRSANLNLTVTPNNVVVTGTTIEWKIYVSNSGDGPAYGASLLNTLPNNLEVNTALTNAANAGYPVTVSGSSNEKLTWVLGDIPSGVTRLITVVADIDTNTGCSIPNGTNSIVAEWGCGGTNHQTTTRVAPNFSFPAGQMLVAHNTTNSVARFCDDGLIEIIIRNTGLTEIFNITAREVLDPASGLTLIPGTVTYSTNSGGSWELGGNPTGTGSAGNPYTWTSAQIPPLANLKPSGSSPQEVRIRFKITAGLAFASANPSALASAEGNIACGNPVNSPGTSTAIATEKPNLSVALTGRNLTTGGSYGETVYGGQGEQVEWRIVISNTGNQDARNVRFRHALAGTNPSSVVINGPGYTNVPYTSNTYINVNNSAVSNTIPAGSSVTYYITETLGNNCVPGTLNTADIVWGCYAPNPITSLTSPGIPSDTASLVMSPNLNGASAPLTQSITSLTGGRARVDLTFTNTGGTATEISITDTLPSGMVYDSSVPVSINRDTSVVARAQPTITWNNNTTVPVFSLNPTNSVLYYGERIVVSFYIYSTHNDPNTATTFPDLGTAEGTPTLDPTLPANGTNNVKVNYRSTCGQALDHTITPTINLLTPDLDITAMPASAVLTTSSGAADRDFSIQNVGDAGSSAGYITVIVKVGKGWVVPNVASPPLAVTYPAGTTISGLSMSYNNANPDFIEYTYTLPSSVTIDRPLSGNSPTLRVRLNTTVQDNGASLLYSVEVRGETRNQAGNTIGSGIYYSRDRGAARIIGTSLSKSLATTKNDDGFTAGSTEVDSTGSIVMIGEDVAFNVGAQIFGLVPGSEISGIVVHDTLNDSQPNGNASNHVGLGYLGHTDFGLQNVTAIATPPTPLDAGRIAWALSYNGTGTKFVFNSEVRARVLNIAANDNNKVLKNNLGIRFTYLGETFLSNDADDGFSGGTTSANLHAEASVTVRRPAITVTKTARNLTRGQVAFSNSIAAQASEQIQYKVVITATSGRAVPIYDILATDLVPAKMTIDAASIGADTNGDNVVDVVSSGALSGNTITFNQTTTNIATAGLNFDKLNSGSSITLLYTVTVNQSVVPSEVFTNTINVSGDTLPGASGSQLAPQHPTGHGAGAAQITASAASATVIIDAVQPTKSLLETSVGNDTSTTVLVGEQARFQLTYVLPEGTVPNFTVVDKLPSGLALLETPTVTIGSAISGGQPTITPVTLPANGNPLTVTWDFGTRIVSTGTVAQRTVTITYLTQVRNIAANSNGTTLTNNASYSFTGAPVNQTPVTLTVRTPGPVITKTVSPNANFDTGDTLTYTITINNSASQAPAYDINILDTLPAKTTFVTGSTNIITSTGVTGVPGAPDHTAPTLVWGANQDVPLDIDIAAGGTLSFSYQVTVNDDASAPEILSNQAVVTWSSLNGDAGPDLGIPVGAAGTTLGERTGTGVAPNNLRSQVVAPATVGGVRTLTKTASGHTLPINAPVPPPTDAFRVGDIVTYTVVLGIPEGTTENAVITDTLPGGMELVSWSPITPTGDNLPLGNPFSYTAPVAGVTGPSAGATGTLTWQLGTIVNQGDNDTNNNTLTLVYTAKILDTGSTPATPVTQNKNNSAILSYKNGLGNTVQTLPASGGVAPVSVKQPLITLDKSRISPATNVVIAGDTVRFRLTVSNTGSGPAYNVKLTDTIPSGMRAMAPVQVAASLNAANVMATLIPSWNSGSGEMVWALDDTQPILPGQTLVVDYDVVVDVNAPRGATLTNSAVVNEYFSKESASLDNRRQYTTVGPETEDIIVSQVLSGFVYHDLQPNGTRDLGEDWTGSPTVRVNLVNTATNTVVKTTTVPSGNGAFSFTSLTPGNYRLIVTTTASSTVATAPTGFIFSSPSNGEIPIIISTGDIVNQTFGLYRGRSVTGRVFEDNGASGGTAHDGIQNGAETGIANVTVRITSSDGLTVYDEIVTDGNGDFVLQIPGTVTNGTPLLVQQINLPDWLSVSGSVGNTAGTYTRATDRIAFTYNSSTSYSGLRFGDVRPPQFLTDGAQTILPGATATYSHQFIAPTTGSVSFSLATVQSPVLPGWSTLIYRDTNNNGILDPAEPLVTGAVSVTAGQTVALIVKDFSPPGGLYGAQNQTTITATFTYTGVMPALSQVLIRRDLTTLGLATVDGLKLVKATNKATALPGETITYTITYTNNGTGPITTLVIHDQTPTYTIYTSSDHGPLPASLTGCIIAAPAVGQTGGITWTFSGTLQPGSSGTVSYTVTIID